MKADLRSTRFYALHGRRSTHLSPQQFYRLGQGMYGGPRGTYGAYIMGPNTTPADLKNQRERQSGE